MTDFKLFADIIPNFKTLKKRAKKEDLELPAGSPPVKEQKKQTKGILGMGATLGKIGVMIGAISAILEPFAPVIQMLGSILKVLSMFFLPLIIPIMRLMMPVLQGLSTLLEKWLGLNKSIGDTVSGGVRKGIEGLAQRQNTFSLPENIVQELNPVARAGYEILPFVSAAMDTGREVVLNVLGITDTGTANTIEKMVSKSTSKSYN